MSFQFVSKSVTLNDLERRNGRYIALQCDLKLNHQSYSLLINNKITLKAAFNSGKCIFQLNLVKIVQFLGDFPISSTGVSPLDPTGDFRLKPPKSAFPLTGLHNKYHPDYVGRHFGIGWCRPTTRWSAIAERPRCRVRYSFGKKWKTGTEIQYFTDIIGLSSTTVKIMRLKIYRIRWKQ